MRIITKEEIIMFSLPPEDEDYQPLLTIEEQIEGVVLELTTPVELDGVPTGELTVKPPIAEDLLNGADAVRGKKNSARTVSLLAKSCGVPPKTIQKLHGRDLNRLATVVGAFTE